MLEWTGLPVWRVRFEQSQDMDTMLYKDFCLKQGTDPKLGDTKIRRNSVTTLKQEEKSTSPLERQATVPHGFNVSKQVMQ